MRSECPLPPIAQFPSVSVIFASSSVFFEQTGFFPQENQCPCLWLSWLELSETRRPGCGETISKGFTYWSGMRDGHHVKRVAVDISSRLELSLTEAAMVDERIMRLSVKHSLGFMFVVAVYAPTKDSKKDMKP